MPDVPPSPSCPLCRSDRSAPCYEGPDRSGTAPGSFAYRRCADCAADFQHPWPDAATVRGYYPDDYVAFAPEPPKPARALERAVLRRRAGYRHLEAPAWARALAPLVGCWRYRGAVPFTGGGRLLDVGCGGGKFLAAMQSLGWRVTGLDADPRAVEACRRQGVEARVGEIQQDGLPAGAFDCVTARHVIEHVLDPRAFVAGMARVLAAGGRLHLRTPNARALGRERYGADWYANDVPRHLLLLDPANLHALLAEHGLERVRLRTRSTPKVLLNSEDLRRRAAGRPSRYRPWRRLAARPRVWLSQWLGRGYEIVADYRKRP